MFNKTIEDSLERYAVQRITHWNMFSKRITISPADKNGPER